MDSYKKRLAGIDCKHFDQGRGRCPFGSSCFYRHSDEHGRPMVCPSISCSFKSFLASGLPSLALYGGLRADALHSLTCR